MVGKLKVVSLFSGLGGIDYGLEAAGYSTVYATDIDSDCCNTIALNRNWTVECLDVHALNGKRIFKLGDIDAGECDLMVGGPPCQPFSKSGFGSDQLPKGMKDKRADTIGEFFRLVNEIRPKVFMIENVPQFISNPAVERYLLKRIDQINSISRTRYKMNVIKLNCADYGVPQIRQRIFIIASRDGKDFSLPSPSFGPVAVPHRGIRKYRSAWDAIHRIKLSSEEIESLLVGGKWGPLLDSIPAGSNYLWHTRRGGGKPIFKWRARFWHFLLKLHPNLPAWTIPAQPGMHTGPFHWDNRRLSSKELCALQTLPRDLEVFGSFTSAKKQIGNAVPSAIAEYLGIQIRA